MRWFNRMPINRKLTTMMLAACIFSLGLAGSAMIAAEWYSARRGMVESLKITADLLGRSCTASLAFHREEDAEDVNKTLSALQADEHILAAGVYDKSRRRFGEYVGAGEAGALPVEPPAEGARFDERALALSQAIMSGDKRVGTIYLRADLKGIYRQIELYAGIVGVVLMVTVAMSLVVSAGLRRLVAAPILALSKVARHVAEERNYSVRATVRHQDEVGALTEAFNQMLGEIEAGQRSILSANNSLQKQAGEIGESIEVLTRSSTDILATCSVLAAGAAQTATAIRETTAILQDVQETAQNTSQSAKAVAEGAHTVVEISLNGKKSVEGTIQGMEQVKKQVDSISESMMRLSEQTQAIGQILSAVDDLAAQSNLLAVNASIEAAKAGEHGRGFMVVAQEVRNLAEQSKQATTQVKTILLDVRKAAATAMLATEQGSVAVQKGAAQSNETGASIDSLSKSVAAAAQAASRIADASGAQLAGTQQVAMAMGSIEQTSTQNAIGARQLEGAAQSLKKLGEKLKQSLVKG